MIGVDAGRVVANVIYVFACGYRSDPNLVGVSMSVDKLSARASEVSVALSYPFPSPDPTIRASVYLGYEAEVLAHFDAGAGIEPAASSL